jgi:protein phosphatase
MSGSAQPQTVVRQSRSHLDPFHFDATAATHAGCVRKLNEDACLNRPDVGLWAVADGMGGHAAGDVASRIVVEALSQVSDFSSAFSFRRSVRTALFGANAKLQSLALENLLDTVGSTAVVLMAHGGHYACTWAGDSRAYVFRAGELIRITCDHSVAQELVTAGALSENMARARSDSNVITRAVGAGPTLELDGVYGRILAHDRFLLCSDGLLSALTEDEIAAPLGNMPGPEAVGTLIKLALARGASDNVTCIVVDARDAKT